MNPSFIFPAIMCGLSACASCVYGLEADWRHTIYWAAAAVLTAAVTF